MLGVLDMDPFWDPIGVQSLLLVGLPTPELIEIEHFGARPPEFGFLTRSQEGAIGWKGEVGSFISQEPLALL